MVPIIFDESYDRAKSEWTKKTRGIDFVEARKIWLDPRYALGPANSVNGEDRWLIIGQAIGRLWTACFTDRPTGIRVISVRPPREIEKEVYNAN